MGKGAKRNGAHLHTGEAGGRGDHTDTYNRGHAVIDETYVFSSMCGWEGHVSTDETMERRGKEMGRMVC